MKKENVVYIHPNVPTYLSAAIESNGKYLLIRSALQNEFLRYGHYWPGCKRNDKYDDEEYLREQVRLKYNINIRIDSFIGDVVLKDHNGRFVCLCIFKCSIKGRFAVDTSNIIAKFYSPEDFKVLRFDTADGKLAERIAIFHRVYEGDYGNINRSNKDNEKAIVYYKALRYFGDRVSKQDVLDFQSLVKTNASIDEIKTAFYWICERSGTNIEEYIQSVEKEKNENEK